MIEIILKYFLYLKKIENWLLFLWLFNLFKLLYRIYFNKYFEVIYKFGINLNIFIYIYVYV